MKAYNIIMVLWGVLPLGRSFPAFQTPNTCSLSHSLKVSDSRSKDNSITNDSATSLCRRRSILAIIATLPLCNTASPSLAAMANTQTAFKVGQSLTMAEAEARLQEGRQSAQYLLDHYDEICQGGGDNVRRYLGTVGTTSGLFGISKVMNTLVDKADDFVEYTELSNEILKAIQQADGSAYMAIFVTTSTSQTPPSKYYGDAKIEVKRCIKALDELAALIDLKM
jgi:hypothetical protein